MFSGKQPEHEVGRAEGQPVRRTQPMPRSARRRRTGRARRAGALVDRAPPAPGAMAPAAHRIRTRARRIARRPRAAGSAAAGSAARAGGACRAAPKPARRRRSRQRAAPAPAAGTAAAAAAHADADRRATARAVSTATTRTVRISRDLAVSNWQRPCLPDQRLARRNTGNPLRGPRFVTERANDAVRERHAMTNRSPLIVVRRYRRAAPEASRQRARIRRSRPTARSPTSPSASSTASSTSRPRREEADGSIRSSASFFGGDGSPQQRWSGKGSGVIVTASGRILTNAHVVNGADDITVTLHDGTELDAKVVGKDTKADLAVIQLEGKFPALKPIPWGDSSTLRLGEVVLAIGDRLGVGKSVSMGIVSAKGRGGCASRSTRTSSRPTRRSTRATRAARSSTSRASSSASTPRSRRAAAATRASASRSRRTWRSRSWSMLIKDGKVSRGYLGVGIATRQRRRSRRSTSCRRRAACSSRASRTAAPPRRRASSQGDVITAINGTEVKTDDALQATRSR